MWRIVLGASVLSVIELGAACWSCKPIAPCPFARHHDLRPKEPVSARWTNGGRHEVSGRTRDVSSAGPFFYAEFAPENGSQIEVMVTLRAEVTGSEAKSVLCRGRVVRVEAVEQEAALKPKYGVAVQVESYELIGES